MAGSLFFEMATIAAWTVHYRKVTKDAEVTQGLLRIGFQRKVPNRSMAASFF
jgi:hypothetical protein